MSTKRMSTVERVRLEQYQKAKAKPEAERTGTDRYVIRAYEKLHPDLVAGVDATLVKTYESPAAYAADAPHMAELGWRVVATADVTKEPSIVKRAAFGLLFARPKHTFTVTYGRAAVPDAQ